MRLWAAGLAIATAAIAPSPPGSAATPAHNRITDLKPITLALGENNVAHFAPDGRDARIIMAWRGNGNAHSDDVYMVLMPGGEMRGEWNIVGVDAFERHHEFWDTIADAPHTGEDYLRSVHFAYAKVDGKPETLLITAERQAKESLADRVVSEFEIYQLVHQEDAGGTTDQFQLIDAFRSTLETCNSELAFARQFGLPLDKNYGGPNEKDGCP
jgi:hypothetical protein